MHYFLIRFPSQRDVWGRNVEAFFKENKASFFVKKIMQKKSSILDGKCVKVCTEVCTPVTGHHCGDVIASLRRGDVIASLRRQGLTRKEIGHNQISDCTVLLYFKINPISNARFVSTLTMLNWSSLKRPSKAIALMLRLMMLLSRILKTLVGKASFINTKMPHICVKICKDFKQNFVLQFIFSNLCKDVYVYM